MNTLLWGKYRDQHTFRTYISFYAGYGWQMAFVLFMFFVKSSPAYVIPIITADIINAITNDPEHAINRIYVMLLGGLIIILQNIPTHIIYARSFSKVSRKVECELRTALCARLQHLSMNFHTSSKMGVLQTKVLRDVENVEMLTNMLVSSLPTIATSMIVALVVTAFRAPMFLVFYLILIPFAMGLFLLVRRRIRENNRRFRQNIEAMNGRVAEMLRLIPVTRAHHLEDEELNRVHSRLEDIRLSGVRLDTTNAVFGSIDWSMIMSFNLFTLCLASYLYLNKVLDIGVGDIVLLAGYFNTISGGVMQLLNMFPIMTKGTESVQSIGEILECPDIEQNEGKTVVDSVNGEFEFQNVGFHYADSNEEVLHDFSLKVKQGETIALVGPSGAGKTTIAQLIIGFIRPTSGRLLLDGKDMNGLDLRTYRRFISVVTQETILFDGTIRDNIVYGIPGADNNDIVRVLKAASMENFVRELPDGINTPVKENGARLSGGQRQRIAIARALIRDPKVLLLDEATSALDVDSEAEIKRSLDVLVKGRTTFIVAHRLSTIQNADRIVVMDKGRILEVGSHSELLAADGRYAEMYRKFSMTE